jgi:hypothetical protein
MILSQNDRTGSGAILELKTGRVWITIPSSSMRIITPDMTADLVPGQYAVGTEIGQYTRVIARSGGVTGLNQASGRQFTVSPGQSVVIGSELGLVSPPQEVNKEEFREIKEWDIWAFEIHDEFGKNYMFNSATARLARLAAQDAERSGQVSDDANKMALAKREEDRINRIKNAFLQFCIDTGQPPTTLEGYTALQYNPGKRNWRGPYYKESIPPIDSWGMEIRYYLKRDPKTGNQYGEIISAGPNRIYSGGRTDDIKVIVPYYRHMK